MPRIRATAPAATAVLIVLGAVSRVVAAQSVGLGVSESYYFGAARHLSLSYFDHPPAAAFLAWVSLTLTGDISSLVLRFPFILLFAGTTWLMFLTGRRLFGPWAGFFAALLLNLTPVFSLSAGMFLQPDGPLMCFWLATLYLLAPPLLGDPGAPGVGRPWAMAGAMLGLTLLSKYTAVFLIGGAFLWMVTGRNRRRWLARPEPYLALAVAVVLFMPVLIWNAEHEWISFRWQAARGTAYQGIHLSWLLQNIAGQMVEVSPWMWALLVMESFRAWRKQVGSRSVPSSVVRARRFLLCFGVPPIVAYTTVAAYADIGNHFHWGTPGYLTLLLGLGATFDGWFRRRVRVATVMTVSMAVASIAVMVLASVQAATGRFSVGYGAVSELLANGNDPTIEMLDYDALQTEFAARGLLHKPGLPGLPGLFVFSDRHYVAGKVDYALKGQLPFLLLNSDDPREYAFFEPPARWVGHEGVLVSQRGSLPEIRADYGRYCSSVEALGPVPIERNGIVEVTLYLYRCERLVAPFPLPYG